MLDGTEDDLLWQITNDKQSEMEELHDTLSDKEVEELLTDSDSELSSYVEEHRNTFDIF